MVEDVDWKLVDRARYLTELKGYADVSVMPRLLLSGLMRLALSA